MKAVFQKIHTPNETTFSAFRFKGEVFDAPWHYHPEYELTLIVEGSGMRYVGNHVNAFSSGDMVLLGSGLPHCWRIGSLPGAESIVIQWRQEALPQIAEFAEIHRLLDLSQRGIRYSEDLSQDFHELVEAKSAVVQYSLFVALLHKLTQVRKYDLLAGESYQADVSAKTSDRLTLIHQYISEHFHEQITLADMGQLLHVTSESFSRFFSQRMKKPFFSFLNEYRINRASRMLIETDMQVSEIAFACGYESPPFFFKQFKKYKKFSPLDFRKKYQESAEGS